MQSKFDEKVNTLFKSIMKKLQKKKIPQTISISIQPPQEIKKVIDKKKQRFSKSLLQRYNWKQQNEDKNNSSLQSKDLSFSTFSRTFVNIKNARYQLSPIKQNYAIKSIQFPIKNMSSMRKKIITPKKKGFDTMNQFYYQPTEQTRRSTNKSRNQYKLYNNPQKVLQKTMGKQIFSNTYRRLTMKKKQKTQDKIEGWRQPTSNFIEEDIMKFE